jgi:hypothetical protein
MRLSLPEECRGRAERALAALAAGASRDARHEMKLRGAVAASLLFSKGPARPETNVAYMRALEVAESLDDAEYRLRALYQFGEFGARPISAFALFSDTGYTMPATWGAPRLALKADVASGGDSRGTGTLGTFYPLFPKNNYFNEANIQTFMNYMDLYPYAKIQPRPDLGFMAGVDVLWRENTQDSFYEPPGLPVVPGNANNKRFLGEALNLQVEWQATPNLDINTAAVRFLADGFLRAAGAHDITWVGAWATFNF